MANRAAGPSDEVKHSRRQPGVAQHFVEANAGEGSVAGRFENDCVAGDQSAGGHARGQCERKVERRDHGPDAVGFQHAAGLLGAGAAHGQFVAVVFLHLSAVVEDEVDSLGNFGDGFKAVLADLEAEERGKFKLTPRHQSGGLAQKRGALWPAEVPPHRRSGLGSGDGFACLVAASALKIAEQGARVGRRGVGERAVFGLLRLSGNEHGVRVAEFAAHLFQRCVESLMEFLPE